MPEHQKHLYIGLDLGKRRDFSALAILEYHRQWDVVRNLILYTLDPVNEVTQLAIRQLKRLPLETNYTDVADTVRTLINKATRNYDVTLIVDATGVGQPIVEMFEGLPPRATLVPVVITGAGSETKAKHEWRVPKQDLIAGLQVMLESEQLGIAQDLTFAPALLEELVEMRAIGAKTEAPHGEHDDLVIAVALAAWRVRRFAPTPANAPGKTGFRNNAFGEAIYGAGSSPWNWPTTRRKDAR